VISEQQIVLKVSEECFSSFPFKYPTLKIKKIAENRLINIREFLI